MSCPETELDKFFCDKNKELKKLNEEYQLLLESKNYKSVSEIEYLNSKLCNLMAEIEVLQKCGPEIMPKIDSLLYAWAKHTLEESIQEKERILNNLDEILKEYATKSKIMLEEARSKNELLHCLHRKMIRRLRRLSRRFPTLPAQAEKMSKSTRDISGKVLLRSFYRVLKEFVVELQDRTFESENWDQCEPVFIDETYCEEHIKILCDSKIVQKSTKNPQSYYLKSSME